MSKALDRGFEGLTVALSVLGLLVLGACSMFDGSKPGAPPPPAYMPVEFAMPAGSSIDRDATVVVGNNLNWYGTLAITSDTNMDDAHQFYSAELPREGWEPIAALISNRAVLQFLNRRQGRACIVMIDGRTVGGSHIEVIVAPLITAHGESASEAGVPRPRPMPR